MTSFRAGDIVSVPFPHVESSRINKRPALIICDQPIGPDGLVIWALMITSATNKGWPGDVEIPDHMGVGLPIPSVIRTEKISTIEVRDATPIGRVSDRLFNDVLSRVINYLPAR